MIFIGGKCPGLILTLFPTYLIQLPVLSFTSSHLSLSPAAQNSFIILSLKLSPSLPWAAVPASCLIFPIPHWAHQHLTTQGTACHALTLLWWENVDCFSWFSEMGPQMLHHLGSVIFNVTAASCDTRLAVFCIQPHWCFKTHTRWYVFHKQIISFT